MRSGSIRLWLVPLAAALAFAPATAKPRDRATGQADEGEQKLAKLLAGATPGKPRSCLSDFDRREGHNIPGIGVLYGSGRTVYLNRFEGGCPNFSSFDILVTQTPTGDLCRGDIARIVDSTSHVEHGACGFGDFVPYTRPKR